MSVCPKCATPSVPGEFSCRVCGCPLLGQNGAGGGAALHHSTIAWENISELGVARALGRTAALLLLKPSHFFESLSRHVDGYMAWLYGLIAGSIGLVFGYLWTHIFSPWAFEALAPFAVDMSHAGSAATALVMAPVVVTLNITVFSAYCHGLISLFGLRKRPFRATFAVVSYAQTGALWNIVPLVGNFVAFVWTLYIVAAGVQRLHHIGRLRFLAIILIPAILLGAVAVGLLVVVITMGLLSGSFLKDIFEILR